jgi:hypothetical protein
MANYIKDVGEISRFGIFRQALKNLTTARRMK